MLLFARIAARCKRLASNSSNLRHAAPSRVHLAYPAVLSTACLLHQPAFHLLYPVWRPQVERGHSAADITVVVIALVLQVLVLLFGYITWGQFGWRTYSKLAADMRIKSADEQRTSFVLVNCFMTLLKLDIQVHPQS